MKVLSDWKRKGCSRKRICPSGVVMVRIAVIAALARDAPPLPSSDRKGSERGGICGRGVLSFVEFLGTHPLQHGEKRTRRGTVVAGCIACRYAEFHSRTGCKEFQPARVEGEGERLEKLVAATNVHLSDHLYVDAGFRKVDAMHVCTSGNTQFYFAVSDFLQ